MVIGERRFVVVKSSDHEVGGLQTHTDQGGGCQ